MLAQVTPPVGHAGSGVASCHSWFDRLTMTSSCHPEPVEGCREGPSPMKARWRLVAITVFFAAYALLLISSASPWPDGQDGVNYLLGLKDYDLGVHQPHFPGYPVYIAMGRFFHLLLPSPEWSLIILSIFSGVAAIYIFFRTAIRAAGLKAAALSAVALAANPLFFSFSHKIFAETQAVALLLLAIAILVDPLKAAGRTWLTGGVVLGLMLGVRLSYWPYALFYLLYGLWKAGRPHAAAGIAAGILLWLIPQAVVTGPVELLNYAVSFTAGHFTDWGGSAFNGQPFAERLSTFVANIVKTLGFSGGISMLRIPWLFFCLYALYDLAARRVNNKGTAVFAGASFFYIAWAFFGQNTEHIRHLLPLLPLFLLVIAPVMERNKKFAAVAVFFLVIGLAADHTGRENNRPPAADFFIWADSQPSSDAVYYCGETKRFSDYYPTRLRVIHAKDTDSLYFKIKSTWPAPDEVYVCDDVRGFKPPGEPAAVFPARRGDPVDRTLSVYRY